MKLIESKVEYLPQDKDLEGVYKQIEKCGRVSYKSEDKITEDSAEPFVDRMIKSKHFATLEHGTMYLKWGAPGIYDKVKGHTVYDYVHNPYSKSRECLTKESLLRGSVEYKITTNYRVLVENNWLDDLRYLCSPTEYHEKRYTFKFTCSRAIANELIRHRAFSFMQESQRFVNYSKDKFGNEITFIKPSWVKDAAFDANIHLYNALYAAEVSYFDLLTNGAAPQQARDVLPNATKTELIMTGFSSDWRYLLDLRLFEKTGAVHPDMLDLMKKLQKVAEEAGIWDNIMKHKSKFD